MISADAAIIVTWVDLNSIVWDDQPIDWAQVEFYASQLAGNQDHLSLPTLNADMTVRDGRHRLKAHQLVGRTHARVNVVTDPARW